MRSTNKPHPFDHEGVYLSHIICYTRTKNEAVMTIKRAVKYFVYANLVAWLMTFSYVGLLAYSLIDYAPCGIGNVQVDGCILPLDFPE